MKTLNTTWSVCLSWTKHTSVTNSNIVEQFSPPELPRGDRKKVTNSQDASGKWCFRSDCCGMGSIPVCKYRYSYMYMYMHEYIYISIYMYMSIYKYIYIYIQVFTWLKITIYIYHIYIIHHSYKRDTCIHINSKVLGKRCSNFGWLGHIHSDIKQNIKLYQSHKHLKKLCENNVMGKLAKLGGYTQ